MHESIQDIKFDFIKQKIQIFEKKTLNDCMSREASMKNGFKYLKNNVERATVNDPNLQNN